MAELKKLRQRIADLEHENEVLIGEVELLESDKVEVYDYIENK